MSKKTGLGALAPRPKTQAPAAPPKGTDAPEIASSAQPEQRGPRGGAPSKRIAITLRVTKEQYRKLVEARLDAGGTIHDLLLRSVAYYFENEHGTKF